MSGIPVPREGEDDDDALIIVAPVLPPPEPLFTQQFSASLPTLKKLYGDGNEFYLFLKINFTSKQLRTKVQ